MINEKFAKKYFPERTHAVGHRIGMGSDPGTKTDIEVVGVFGDMKYEDMRDEVPHGDGIVRMSSWISRSGMYGLHPHRAASRKQMFAARPAARCSRSTRRCRSSI